MSLRVLLINYEFPPIGGGAGNATANIARCLARRGVEVLVLTSRFGDLPAHEVRDQFTVRRVAVVRRRPDQCSPLEMMTFILGGIAPSVQVARRWKPDVACAFFGVPSGPIALALHRLFGIPYLVSLRGGDVPGFLQQDLGVFHRLTLPVIRTVWRCSAGLIANSQGLANLARKTWPGAPIEIIPNGVDVDVFRPPERPRPADPLRLLCVGRLVRQKGIACLLDALTKIRASSILRVVGDGPDRLLLERLTVSLGLQDRVQFVGWATRQELPAHYQWADVFVLASFEEGMPNVILEALAAGLPVVATDVAGSQELVVPGKNGFLVAVGDPLALAGTLDRLSGDPAQFRRLGEHSRQTALARRWEMVAERYHQALRAATGMPCPTMSSSGARR